MPDDGTDGLEVLTDEECLALLTTHHLGRIGFVDDGWPVILPVNYVFDEPSIVVRTGPGGKLDDMPLSMVAFEIDEADPAGAWGWSVLAQGPAFDISDSIDEYSDALRRLPVHPHAPGAKLNWLKITARRVSGRRFGTPPPLPST
ncbi:MAG TPA: pyridoxamine 5'-phosphate oxidase family protein [Acidimicrobiales bacterium]|nr:pyridoxamine 5'-phosphate oxidase family protein [Acidimicrobiales bacterium]